jgi:hypothetical protein
MKRPRLARVPRPFRARLDLERLEDRLAPSANILVSVDGASSQQLFKEFTQQGSLVRSLVIPPNGTQEDARDLLETPDGRIFVYNGTEAPALSSYDPAAGSWSHQTFPGWSCWSNGGIGQYQNYVFVSDNFTFASGNAPKGIIRFNLTDGTAARFASDFDPMDLTVGQDGLVYGMSTWGDVRVYDPQSMALLRSFTLPGQYNGSSLFFAGLAVDAAGEMFVATTSNRLVLKTNPAGNSYLASAYVNGSGTFFGWLRDIDISADGTQLAVGTGSGNVDLMTTGLVETGWFSAASGGDTFVAFAPDAPPPPPSLSVGDVTVTEGSGGVTANFTVTLSAASDQTVTVDYATADGSALAGSDYDAASGTLTFAPGETQKTVSVAITGDSVPEPTEAFTLNLSNAANATIARPLGTGTILDDDAPSLTIGDVSLVEGDSGTSVATFTVTLSGPTYQAVTVGYDTASGTAFGGIDYVSGNGTLTFAPGETSKTVSVTVNGDVTYEPDETFTVNLFNASGATIARPQATGTILNDDAQPIVTVGSVSVTEGGAAVFTVTLSNPSYQPITVNYATANGSATAGSDYTAASGTLTFNPGETSKTVSVATTDDATDEPDETFSLNLSAPWNAALGSPSSGTGTILDNDAAPSITVADVTVTEGDSGSAPAVFTVTLSNPSAWPVTVDYATADGSALAGSDYTSASGTLTFNPGETSKTISVAVLGDTVIEPTEAFTLNLANAANATIARPQATGTILDNDLPSVTIGDVTVSEGNSGTVSATFTVTLSDAFSQTVQVNYATANGTAAAGSDYASASGTLTFAPGETQKTITITVNGDTTYEPDETFTVNLSSPANATIARSQATGTILNDDPLPTVNVGNATVTEGGPAVFTVTLSNPSYQTVTVNYATANGTATAGIDYTWASGTITFAPGETSKTVSVATIDDTTDEPDEIFTLNLTSATNAALGSPSSGTGTVVDNDAAPSITVTDVTVTEGDSGSSPAVFTVTLSNPSAWPVTVGYATADGSALAGSDYTAASGTLTFNPGETSKTVSVAVLGDTVVEPTESFTLNLSNAANASIGRAQATGTILDNDLKTLTINDVTVSEGNGTSTVLFTVTFSAASPLTITVNYATANGTATAGSDYTATSGTLTFSPGQTSKTIPVTITGDITYEPDETFFVNLSGATNATIVRSQATGTILNEDPRPSVSVNGGSFLESSGLASFTVYLSNPSYQTITVNYATADGTALAGSDYYAASGTVTFSPGQTSKTVYVSIINDTAYEQTETFTLSLSGPTNASLGNPWSATAWINNDDPIPTVGVADASVTEGDSGTATMFFTVSLSNASFQTITVSYGTSGGTATAGSDYAPAGGTVTFNPGETSKTVPVTVYGDTFIEANETFLVTLSGPANATLGRSPATGTIVDNDFPALSVNDVSVLEGNSGGAYVNFTLSLSAPPAQVVTLNYATANGTATSGSDYSATSGTLSFNPGETQKTVSVYVYGDTSYEPDETFFLNLSNVAKATVARGQGVGTIRNDDPMPSLTIDDLQANEGNAGSTTFTFTVHLSTTAGVPVTVNYATANGSALAGSDYTAASGTLTIPAGSTSGTFTVTVTGDTVIEPDEAFFVNLSGASNAVITDSQAVATILDDDLSSISIGDATVTEGNWGTTYAALPLTLSQANPRAVTVSWWPYSGTATSSLDFGWAGSTVTFAPGETQKTLLVQVLGDLAPEANETFTVSLSSPLGASLGRATGTVTIVDDDPAGSYVSLAPQTTGSARDSTGSGSFTQLTSGATSDLNVSKSVAYPSESRALLEFDARSVTAASVGAAVFNFYQNMNTFGPNYANEVRVYGYAADGTVTLADATRPAVFLGAYAPYQNNGWLSVALDRAAVVSLLSQSGYIGLRVVGLPETAISFYGQSGYYPPRLGFSYSAAPAVPGVVVNDAAAAEGNPSAGATSDVPVTISLTQPSTVPVTVTYATANGTATAGSDYTALTNGVLIFWPGEVSKTVIVKSLTDGRIEPDETFTFSLTNVSNGTAARGSGTVTLLNDDHAPVPNPGPDRTVGEALAVAFDASGSIDPDGDSMTFAWNFGDGGTATGVSPQHTYADNGVYTVTLTATDVFGNVGTATARITVTNRAPTSSVSGPSSGVRGQDRTFTFTAADPSAVDQAAPFTYTVDWGDGSTQTVTGPAGGVSVAHTFTAEGSYTVAVTATDKDGGTGPAATASVGVAVAALQGTTLVVGGSTGADQITLTALDAGGVSVLVNGASAGDFAGAQSVVVYAQAGDDTVTLAAGASVPFAAPAFLFGGDGNDTLDASASTAPAVLVGGAGDDLLFGGSGRNILIGGLGSDALHGNAGEDLLVGGTTDYDANLTALTALRDEWARTDADFATRIAHLSGTQSGGLNGGYKLTAQTAHDDGAADDLWGGLGADWMIYVGTGPNADRRNDWENGDAGLQL